MSFILMIKSSIWPVERPFSHIVLNDWQHAMMTAVDVRYTHHDEISDQVGSPGSCWGGLSTVCDKI